MTTQNGGFFGLGSPTFQSELQDLIAQAETIETNINTQATNAGNSETNAATSESNASTSAANAATSETNASASATNASTSETNASASAVNATTSETNAAASETKALKWAEEAVDVEVETGKYSAKHHSDKAEGKVQVLRDDLASTTDVAKGAALVGYRGTSIRVALDRRTLYVDSIVDLKALDTTILLDGQQVLVKGYHADTEIGGGQFYWDATSTATDNGGTVFSVSGVSTGRWIRATSGLPSVWDFGASQQFGTVVSGLATLVNDSGWSGIRIPYTYSNIELDQSVVFRVPGLVVKGEMPTTYITNSKLGHIYPSTLFTGYMFDFGASRVSGAGNTDHWTMDGVSLNSDTVRTDVYGLAFTSQHNGPDRGATVRNSSFRNLQAGIYIRPREAGVGVSLANLDIEGCNLSNCVYGVLSDGNLLGLRFVGNQAEQNSEGAVHGSFTSSVTITDNMLEGQKNALRIHNSVSGNRLSVLIERNYFEAQSGEYAISLKETTGASYARIGHNYVVNSASDDYCVVDGGRWIIDYFDSPMITLKTETRIRPSSRFFNQHMGYKVRYSGTNGRTDTEVMTTDYHRFVGVRTSEYNIIPAGTATINTPFGVITSGRSFTNDSGYMSFNVSCLTGDLLSFSTFLNVLPSSSNNYIIQVFDENYASIGSNQVFFTRKDTADQGGWMLVTHTVRATGPATTTIRFRFLKTSGDDIQADIASVALKNHGPFLEGEVKEINPTCPLPS